MLLTFDFNSDVCTKLSYLTNMSLMQSLLSFFKVINIDNYMESAKLPGSILKKKKIYASLIIRVFIGSLSDLDVLSELVQLTSITVDKRLITDICAKFN